MARSEDVASSMCQSSAAPIRKMVGRKFALGIADGWEYGFADVEVTMTAHADGAMSEFRLIVGWLLQEQASGDWLIQRQLWNRKPD